jgi:hypothetical protein
VSGDDLSESESGLAGVILVESRRTKSDGDVALDLAAGDLDDGRDNEDNGPRTSKRRRQLKSSSESYMRWYDREAKEQEAEKRKEMVEFELGGLTKGNKRERRKMQNRLAQRAFRARSKIQTREVGPHWLGSDQGRYQGGCQQCCGQDERRQRHPVRLPDRFPCTPSRTTGADENDFMQIANHMSHLEALTEAQTERIGTLTELVDRLQRENASLKQSM